MNSNYAGWSPSSKLFFLIFLKGGKQETSVRILILPRNPQTPSGSCAPDRRPPLDRPSMNGQVKWFNNSKGYGLSAVKTRRKCSCTTRLLPRMTVELLREGERVSFDIVPGLKGPQAVNVARTEGIQSEYFEVKVVSSFALSRHTRSIIVLEQGLLPSNVNRSCAGLYDQSN
jgi:CspA family cold shock protein